jgi:Fe-S cluster biogenesis protein NfuA
MNNNLADLEDRINAGLEKIRPYLQADGGDISLVKVTEDMTVMVKLLGACGTCPMSMQTLKAGVEHTLKKSIPEIKEVINVTNMENY